MSSLSNDKPRPASKTIHPHDRFSWWYLLTQQVLHHR